MNLQAFTTDSFKLPAQADSDWRILTGTIGKLPADSSDRLRHIAYVPTTTGFCSEYAPAETVLGSPGIKVSDAGVRSIEERNRDLVKLALTRAKPIMDLTDDWDGEGSPAVKQHTWQRAKALLHQLVRRADRVFPGISIMIGPEGSLDILWAEPEARTLLNVPAEEDAPITVAGHRADGESVRRTTRGRLGWLAEWLTQGSSGRHAVAD